MSAAEMFLVRPHGGQPEVRQQIAEWVALAGGMVLMATPGGSLIVALAHEHRELVASHPQVAFVGGVSLNPNGRAAEALRMRFETNAARQGRESQDLWRPRSGRQSIGEGS